MPKLTDVKKELATKPAEDTIAEDAIAEKMLEFGKKETKKDKSVTFRINSALYEQYTHCCQELGATNNGMMTMLIKKFVAENKHL